MHITEYIAEKKMSRSAFARKINVNPSYVTMLCAGRLWPGRRLILKILKGTEGRVTPNDILGVDIAAYAAQPVNRRKRNATDGETGRKRQGRRKGPARSVE